MKQLFKNKLRETLHLFSLQITPDFRIHKLFQKNVFKTRHAKHALIIYITRPFVMEKDYRHTNLMECFTAAEILCELGYNVDVIDCDIKQKVDFEKYDLIYGQGLMMEKSFHKSSRKQVRIMYSSGANPIFSDIGTTKKVRDFKNLSGLNCISSARLLPHSHHAQIFLSDAVIVLGGKRTLETFHTYDEQISRYYNLDCFYYNVGENSHDKKDFTTARKHFLWFGSSGALHKGLDVLLEIFLKQNDCTLHVCGLSKHEKEFWTYYRSPLAETANIVHHGFINMESAKFQELMNICGYVVLPSVSEGGAPSVLNVAANGGLVPIISKDCGLDISEYGYIIDTPDIGLFRQAINKAKMISDDELKAKSILVKEYVRKNYTYEKYRQRLKHIFCDILEKKN